MTTRGVGFLGGATTSNGGSADFTLTEYGVAS
jgi:hypothetical protein